MPIANIVDKRTVKYNAEIDAIYEPSFNDNCIKGATQFEKCDADFCYKETQNTTVAEAIAAMADVHFPVTLYLYDGGSIEKSRRALDAQENGNTT